MESRNIIVIGASAGGLEALKQLVSALPVNLGAAVFIAWHMSPDAEGILPKVLNQHNKLHAAHAVNKEPIINGRIYVAPPDKHMIIEKDRIVLAKGPKENGFRPAIDPLFRSAAYVYGQRTIGIILSGALDDGAAGLWVIKKAGGIAIVQDPADAEVPSMPQNALRGVVADYILPAAAIGTLLESLTLEKITDIPRPERNFNKEIEKELHIAMQDNTLENIIPQFGDLTPFTCPSCHGVLGAIKEGTLVRYRCHTGHAFSAVSLLAAIAENIEQKLWDTLRSMEESVLLLNHIGDHFAAINQPHVAALYFNKAKDDMDRSKRIRSAIKEHEQLLANNITPGGSQPVVENPVP